MFTNLLSRSLSLIALSPSNVLRLPRGVRLQLERLEDRLTPAEFVWIGKTGNWSDVANWEVNGNKPKNIPTKDDDVVFSKKHDNPYIATADTKTFAGTVKSLTVEGSANVTIELGQSLNVNENGMIKGGTIKGKFPLTFGKKDTTTVFHWWGGVIGGDTDDNASVTLAGDARLVVLAGGAT